MSLAYLISPAFQYENESGKPLVGGTIRVCRHGTTEPYITYADFQGNRNPEYVPLNSKGMAVLLVSDENVYDVYCYDRNGVEQWSRLNVPAGGQGGGGGGGEYYGGYGIDIEEGVISVDPSVVQAKLTEGSGIDIVNNEIGIRVDGSTITVNVDGELEANIPAQVNADWNSSSGVSEILNKPDLSQYATQSDLSTGLSGKQDTLTAGTGIDITGTTISVESPVPAASPSDEGKVLGVTDAQGTVDWVSQPSFTQQQSDWTEADTTDPSFIQNKPAEKSLVAGTGISITEGTTDLTIASTAEALPSKTGHGGEALLVNSSATGLEWGTPTAELFEAVYGTTTYAEVTQAIAAKKIIYCRVPQSGSAVRMAFLAYVGSNNAEFQYYRSKSSRTYSSPTDEVYVYTVNSSGWTTTTRNTGYAIAAGTGLNYSISGGTLTLSADPQQQADWAETDNTDPSYIQNKPSIPSISLLHHTQQVSITAGQYVNPETFNLNAFVPAYSKFYGSLTIERLSNIDNSSAYHFVLAVPNNSMTCNFGDYPAARQSGHNINFFVDNSASDSQYQLYFQLSGQFEAQNITVHVDGIVFN